MASFKDRKKVTTTASASETLPTLWVVSGDIGPFKQGQELKTVDQCLAYARLFMNEGLDEGETFDLADAQILAAMHSINRDGLAPDDADMAWEQAMIKITTGKDTPLEDGDVSDMSANIEPVRSAKEAASKVSKAAEEMLMKAAADKASWDGASITIGEQVWNKDLDQETKDNMPILGTRRRHTRTELNTVPAGMDAEAWLKGNSPVDMGDYKDSTDAWRTYRWTDVFFDALPHRVAKTADLNALKELKNAARSGEVERLCPDKFKVTNAEGNLVPITFMRAATLYTDMNRDRNNELNRFREALAFMQRKDIVAKEFPKVIVGYTAQFRDPEATVQACANAANPIMLYNVLLHKDGTKEREPVQAVSIKQFLRFKLDQAQAGGGTVAALKATTKKGPKKSAGGKAGEAPATGPTAKVEIHNTDQFADALQAVRVWTDQGPTYNMVMAKVRGKDGGWIASEILAAWQVLNSYATNAEVQKIAKAYDDTQNRATADADKAAAEAAKAAAA